MRLRENPITRALLYPFVALALAILHVIALVCGIKCDDVLPLDSDIHRALHRAGCTPIRCERHAAHFGQHRGVVKSSHPRLSALAPGKAFWG